MRKQRTVNDAQPDTNNPTGPLVTVAVFTMYDIGIPSNDKKNTAVELDTDILSISHTTVHQSDIKLQTIDTTTVVPAVVTVGL